MAVVDELGVYLLARGVAHPSEAHPSLTVPSLWIVPARAPGAQPREGERATVTLRDQGLGGPSPTHPGLAESFIDVLVLAYSTARARLIQRTIRGLLTPRDAVGGRERWQMGTLTVERSFLWRRVRDTDGGVTQSFCFQVA